MGGVGRLEVYPIGTEPAPPRAGRGCATIPMPDGSLCRVQFDTFDADGALAPGFTAWLATAFGADVAEALTARFPATR
jgi:hypothetical protein